MKFRIGNTELEFLVSSWADFQRWALSVFLERYDRQAAESSHAEQSPGLINDKGHRPGHLGSLLISKEYQFVRSSLASDGRHRRQAGVRKYTKMEVGRKRALMASGKVITLRGRYKDKV